MRDIFVARLTELAIEDPRIMLVTGDLGFGVLTNFAKSYPRQYVNAGVAEQNMTGIATGLALSGRIVFTYSIANFSTLRCLEQIRNDAAYHEANVTVVSVGGGFSYGALGMSHHATEDLAIMRALPIHVVAPCDDWETRHAVQSLVTTPGTKYLRLDKSSPGDTSRPGEQFVFGQARRLREGEDVTIVTTGGILEVVLRVAERLASHGIACRVLAIHCVKPIDASALVDAARETGGVVTVEEHSVDGGLGGAVAEVLLESGERPRRFRRIGLRHGFSSIVGSQEHLRRAYGLDENAICDSISELLRAPAIAGSAMREPG
jgi:transketolase